MSKVDLNSLPISLPEGIDYNEYINATYLAVFPADIPIHDLASALAVEQSTGTWVPVPGETPEIRKNHVAKVTAVHEVPDYEFALPNDIKTRSYIIEIAFPVVNIGAQIPMLFTALIGNISMGGQIKLLDVRFPKKYTDGFKGPKFGIEGVRKILGVKDRPLLNNMTKPCTGYTPEIGVELFKAAALGGVDIVKDDELIANASFNSVADRVKLNIEAEKEVFQKKGERTLYAVNISDEIPMVFENAKRAIDAGANAIMVNYLATGFTVLRALAEDPNINVPILAHMDVAGAYYMSPVHGVASSLILGKLARLAGADIVVVPAPYGKAPILVHQFKRISQNLTFPMYDLKPTFPMPSGGITPLNVSMVVKDLGTDIVIGSGGGIHAHPNGPTAGAKAFRQAIDAVMHNVPVEDAANEHPELATAIKVWSDPHKKFKLE